MWRAAGVAVLVSAALIVLSFALDTGSSGARDAAPNLGVVSIYVLAPLSVLWLIIAAIRPSTPIAAVTAARAGRGHSSRQVTSGRNTKARPGGVPGRA